MGIFAHRKVESYINNYFCDDYNVPGVSTKKFVNIFILFPVQIFVSIDHLWLKKPWYLLDFYIDTNLS